MSKQLFFKKFASISIGLGLMIFILSFIPVFEKDQTFSWVSLAFFMLFTGGVYFLAERAAYSPNLFTFSSVIYGVIFIKMIFILMIVLVYKELANPVEAWFLIPFFLIYLAFTIFEVYFMSKLGRIKPPTKSSESEVHSASK